MNVEPKKIGLISIILLGINAIIGSGIFLLPGQVTQLVGNWSLVIYGFVALLVLAIAWCFAQCSTLFERNGGAYVYAKEAFGEFIGFEVGLMRWTMGILAWATMVAAFITALSAIFPAVLHEPVRSLIVFTFVGSLGILNIIGLQFFKRLNNIITFAKLIPLALFVLIGVFYVNYEHYTPLEMEAFEVEAMGSAALMVFYAFGGFETLVVAAGDMKNPKRNLPLAIFIVITICSSLYFLIQLITIGLLGEQLAQSQMPLVDAAHLLWGTSGKWVVLLAMLISIGGINLTSSFITPRSGAALAEDNLLPAWMAKKGQSGTPIFAILITTTLTGVVALSGQFAYLAALSVIARFVQYTATCLSVIALRERLNPKASLIKRLCLVIIPLMALTGIGWLCLQATLSQLLIGLSALVLGVPLYMWQQRKERLSTIESASKTYVSDRKFFKCALQNLFL